MVKRGTGKVQVPILARAKYNVLGQFKGDGSTSYNQMRLFILQLLLRCCRVRERIFGLRYWILAQWHLGPGYGLTLVMILPLLCPTPDTSAYFIVRWLTYCPIWAIADYQI